jgi:predicted ATP-dependent endonuclease of OLD family
LANAYWGKHPYELGISFIGVGGRDYLPFIRVAEGLGLKWFIFSDGEEDTLNAETLINLPDENRHFPPKIKELFDIMEQTLNLLPLQEVINEPT